MEVFAESPTKARQFKAEAEESDRQMAQRVAPAVEVITRALADEVYRAAPFGGADGGTLRDISLRMNATDEQHNDALRRLTSVAGRRGNGKWLPHCYVA